MRHDVPPGYEILIGLKGFKLKILISTPGVIGKNQERVSGWDDEHDFFFFLGRGVLAHDELVGVLL